MSISTRDTRELPNVRGLRLAFQSMAMLDAILMPEWEYRYYSFEFEISPDSTISRGSMRNGSGDDLDAIFGPAGCLIRGFAHEYPMSPFASDPPRVFPGILDDVPPEFDDCRAACHEDWWQAITCCLWRRHDDAKWHSGKIDFPDNADPDGSEFLLSPYDGCAESYRSWAEDYYGPIQIDLAAVTQLFQHLPLEAETIRRLNPNRALTDLAEEMQTIGYPASDA